MTIDEKARAAAVEVAKEMVADRANHWEIADAVIEAYEATKQKPSAASIDAAARYLRETLQAGKRLTAWDSTPKATKKKWLALAEGALLSAGGENG